VGGSVPSCRKRKYIANEKDNEEEDQPKKKKGSPFGNEAYVNSLTEQCQILHEWYLKMTKETDLPPSIMGFISNEVLHSGCSHLSIAFDNVHLLYQYKELDVQLVRVWTLHMIEEAQRLDQQKLEFLDPEFISWKYGDEDIGTVADYIFKVLAASEGKDHIVGAYNAKSKRHWIAVVIDLTTASVIYMDSMDHPQDSYKLIKTAIDRAWDSFMQLEAARKKYPTGKQLYHHFSFPCNKQPPENTQCGFYTCSYMQALVFAKPPIQILDDNHIPRWRLPESALQENDLQSIREEICKFINQEILEKNGKYYSANAHTT